MKTLKKLTDSWFLKDLLSTFAHIAFFFLHLRGTNHIAGSCLSIGKAGGYSKEQDKKK